MTAIADNIHESAGGPCPVCGEAVTIGGVCERCGWLEWFTWEDAGDVHVLRPNGHLLHAEPIQKFLDAYAQRPGTKLVIDLANAQYISSAALSKLLALRKWVLGRKGRLALRSVHPDLWEVFQVTRLDAYFDVEE
jgi:anti-sigma B factor antagonist